MIGLSCYYLFMLFKYNKKIKATTNLNLIATLKYILIIVSISISIYLHYASGYWYGHLVYSWGKLLLRILRQLHENLQRIFRKFSESLQRIFRDSLESSENLQRIFKESLENIQRAFREYSESLENLQRILRIFKKSLKNLKEYVRHLFSLRFPPRVCYCIYILFVYVLHIYLDRYLQWWTIKQVYTTKCDKY